MLRTSVALPTAGSVNGLLMGSVPAAPAGGASLSNWDTCHCHLQSFYLFHLLLSSCNCQDGAYAPGTAGFSSFASISMSNHFASHWFHIKFQFQPLTSGLHEETCWCFWPADVQIQKYVFKKNNSGLEKWLKCHPWLMCLLRMKVLHYMTFYLTLLTRDWKIFIKYWFFWHFSTKSETPGSKIRFFVAMTAVFYKDANITKKLFPLKTQCERWELEETIKFKRSKAKINKTRGKC